MLNILIDCKWNAKAPIQKMILCGGVIENESYRDATDFFSPPLFARIDFGN